MLKSNYKRASNHKPEPVNRQSKWDKKQKESREANMHEPCINEKQFTRRNP